MGSTVVNLRGSDPLPQTLALIAGGQAEAKPVLLLAALLITFGAVLAARASLSQKPVQAD